TLGNVLALAGTNGDFTRRTFDPWGNPLVRAASGSLRASTLTERRADYDALPLAWASQEVDPDTGLTHYHFREYSPSLGGWLTRDPIGLAGGYLNLRSYLGNRPSDELDAWGEVGNYSEIAGQISSSESGKNLNENSVNSSESILSQARNNLKGSSLQTNVSWTLLWIPYPGGKLSVDVSMSGSLIPCIREDGSRGNMAEVTISASVTASIGYGAGGNRGLKRAGENKLRDKNGRYAKNPEEGKRNLESTRNLSRECRLCEETLHGTITIEVGAKVGAVVSMNAYGNATFEFDQPISFDYGTKFGTTGYIGSEIYISVTVQGSGTLIMQ
ncbi:MAG: Cell wall-associated polypeptide, partial [Verrucomicrobiota bacterium]